MGHRREDDVTVGASRNDVGSCERLEEVWEGLCPQSLQNERTLTAPYFSPRNSVQASGFQN